MSRDSRRIAGSGEPLVLLHGLGLSRRTWRPVLAALESRHEVLSLDLPGFGEAAPLPAELAPTVPALTDAVEREMDAAGFATAHVAGNSMGGWIALELARRGRARTVVAISPAGGGTRRERVYAHALLKTTRAVTQLLAPVADAAAATAPARILVFGLFWARPARLAREDAAYAVRAYARAPAFHAACDWLFANRAEALGEIDCPVTIAWGSRDLLLFPRQARHFVARIPGAELVALDRLGHIPMSDGPEQVTDVILARTGGGSDPEPAVSGSSRAAELGPAPG